MDDEKKSLPKAILIGIAAGCIASALFGIMRGALFGLGVGILIKVFEKKEKSEGQDFNANSDANLNKNSTSQKAPNLGNDTRECPFCAEIIKKNTNICIFCGKEVEPII